MVKERKVRFKTRFFRLFLAVLNYLTYLTGVARRLLGRELVLSSLSHHHFASRALERDYGVRLASCATRLRT
jgi:hypothetical protein